VIIKISKESELIVWCNDVIGEGDDVNATPNDQVRRIATVEARPVAEEGVAVLEELATLLRKAD